MISKLCFSDLFYAREALLTHLSQRLTILKQGAPLAQTDLEKYLQAFEADVKLEVELELSETPPNRMLVREVTA